MVEWARPLLLTSSCRLQAARLCVDNMTTHRQSGGGETMSNTMLIVCPTKTYIYIYSDLSSALRYAAAADAAAAGLSQMPLDMKYEEKTVIVITQTTGRTQKM